MQGNLRKFVQTLLGSQRELSFSTLGPDGYPQSVVARYANDGLVVFLGTRDHGHQVRNLATCAKSCITVVSPDPEWGDVRGVTLRGNAAVLSGASSDMLRALRLLRDKFPDSDPLFKAASPPLALIRFDPVAVTVLDHWDGIGFTELVEHPLMA